jgi:hypothetical protein
MAFRIKDLMISVVPSADLDVNNRITILIAEGGECGATGCGTTDCAGTDCGASGCGTTDCAGTACGATGCGTTDCVGTTCGASGCGTTDCVGTACGGTGCGTTDCAGTACGPTGCGTTDCVGTACGPTGCGTTDCVGTECGPTGCGTTAHVGCVASIDERTIFTHDPDELVVLQKELRLLLEASQLQEQAITLRAAQPAGDVAAELPTTSEELEALEGRLRDALSEVQHRRAEL